MGETQKHSSEMDACVSPGKNVDPAILPAPQSAGAKGLTWPLLERSEQAAKPQGHNGWGPSKKMDH